MIVIFYSRWFTPESRICSRGQSPIRPRPTASLKARAFVLTLYGCFQFLKFLLSRPPKSTRLFQKAFRCPDTCSFRRLCHSVFFSSSSSSSSSTLPKYYHPACITVLLPYRRNTFSIPRVCRVRVRSFRRSRIKWRRRPEEYSRPDRTRIKTPRAPPLSLMAFACICAGRS